MALADSAALQAVRDWANARFVRPYQAGDTLAVDIDTAGFVTSSTTQVRFVIPLGRPVASGVTVTLTGATFILRGINGYCHGSAASTRVSATAFSYKVKANSVTVWATFASTTNATNNTPVGIECTGTLVFG